VNSRVDVSALQIFSRIAAGFVGGYFFVWGCITLGISLGMVMGMDYQQAQTLMFLLAFIIYLITFCWTFAAKNIVVVWTVLLGGGITMSLLGWWLGNYVLS